MILLTNRELKSHEDGRVCYICRKYFLKKLAEDINHRKVGDRCHYMGKYRGAVDSICNLKFNVPNEIPVVFHNDSKYNNHFIIKNLANEFEGQFECIDKNNEKYKTFSVPIKKELQKLIKKVYETVKIISYKIKFIDSMGFMATSLSKPVDDLTEEIHEIKCKDCDCFFEYESVKDNLIKINVYLAIKNIPTILMKN